MAYRAPVSEMVFMMNAAAGLQALRLEGGTRPAEPAEPGRRGRGHAQGSGVHR